MIDPVTHRRLDVLPDRRADTLADWLREYPQVKVVCRDGSAAYAEAIRSGAPGADNPDRLASEASFAGLCGVSPIEMSSGKTERHRLNRGGDRHANAALYRIVLTRLRCDARTQAYVDRRTAEGKTRRETFRCLKRYVAREIYNLLQPPTASQASPQT